MRRIGLIILLVLSFLLIVPSITYAYDCADQIIYSWHSHDLDEKKAAVPCMAGPMFANYDPASAAEKVKDLPPPTRIERIAETQGIDGEWYVWYVVDIDDGNDQWTNWWVITMINGKVVNVE